MLGLDRVPVLAHDGWAIIELRDNPIYARHDYANLSTYIEPLLSVLTDGFFFMGNILAHCRRHEGNLCAPAIRA
jgi:hypothetical protein